MPLSSTLLGVKATYDDGDQRAVVVFAGGYLDDVLEAYDDLERVGRQWVGGAPATVLGGTFLEETVRAAYWRDSTVRAPCDVRAIVATNIDDPTFSRMLAGLR